MTPSQPTPVTDGGQGTTPTLSATPYYPDQPHYPGTSLFAPPAPFPPVAAEVSAPPAQIAAQAWAAAMRQRKQPCVMPPWDENTFVLNPTSRVVTVVNGTDVELAPSNPQRIAIIFSAKPGFSAGVYICPGAAMDPNNPVGILIYPNQAPFIVTQKDLLNLAQVEWHGASNSGTSDVYVVEVVLRDWPR